MSTLAAAVACAFWEVGTGLLYHALLLLLLTTLKAIFGHIECVVEPADTLIDQRVWLSETSRHSDRSTCVALGAKKMTGLVTRTSNARVFACGIAHSDRANGDKICRQAQQRKLSVIAFT
jgi:hypothetical protein